MFCVLNFSRCLARLAVSVKLLDKPSDELGPRVVERLKGSAAQFMVAVQDQWRACSWTLDHLVRLSTMLVQLSGPMCLQSSETVASSLEMLRQLVIDSLAVLQDFEALMKSCPSPSSDSQTGQVFQLSSTGLVISRETADSLRSMRSSLTQQLTTVRVDLDKEFDLYWTTSSSSSNWLFSTTQYDCIASGYSTLDSAQQLLSRMVSVAGDRYFGSGLDQLKQRFSAAVQHFQQQQPLKELDDKKKEGAEEEVDKLCQSLLHGIQEIYKKYATASTKQPADEDGDEDDFEVDHLTAKLIGQMQSDLVQLLKLETTTGELQRCMTASRHHGQLLIHCAPVLDQYIHAVEYYFAQQLACLRASCKLLSVLLNVFNQLLSKGFCSPSELDESQDQGGESQFQENESGGLGDGQGAKDVSDQIENEDQLDTARQQGQEEEESQNKDGPKEEENGIEMSQDFDAKLQDREEKEEGDKEDGDESEDSEDDQELDKEMGETGQEADQLEEKLWGSDEEDEKEEEELEEDQGQGDGRQDESQITAKDGQDEDEQETGQDDKEKKKKRPKDTEQDNEDDENVNDDQVDPYHQSNEPPPAPEPLDLPDDLNLDGDNPKDDEEENTDGAEEKDPFDIDAQLKDTEESKEDEEQKEEGGEDETDTKQDEEVTGNPTEEEDKLDEEKGEEDGPKDFEMEEMPPADKSEPDQPLNEPEKAVPSTDQPSKSEAQPATEEAVKGSQDKTARPEQTAETKPEEGEDQGQNQEAENEESEGVGMAESRQASGHEGERKSSINRKTLKEEKEEEKGRGKPNKPGESDPDRALADRQLQKAMQVHTTKPDLSKEKEEKEGVENDDQAVSEANLFEHIKQVDKRSEGDALAKDAATEEQAKEQLQMDKADNDEDPDAVVMEEDEKEETLHEEIDQLESEELDAAPRNKKSRSKRGEPQGMEDGQEDEKAPTDHGIVLRCQFIIRSLY